MFSGSTMSGNILTTENGPSETVIYAYQDNGLHQFQLGQINYTIAIAIFKLFVFMDVNIMQ